MAKQRIFITGIYRSGTTLISRMLNNHPKLWITYDSVHFMRFSYGRFDPVSRRSNAERLIKDTAERIARRYDMSMDAAAVMKRAARPGKISYRSVYDAMMDGLMSAYKPGAEGWGEKTNVCWGKIPGFLEVFPEGKAIHVIRDPRDVMCSYRDMTYEPGYSYLDSAFASLDAFQRAAEFSKAYPKNYYLLKYETLLSEPAAEARKVCDFLGVDFRPSMLDTSKFTDQKGKWWTGDSSYVRKMNKITNKTINRWKNKASDLEVYFVEMINKEQMPAYGYGLSGTQVNRKDWSKLYDIIYGNKILKERYLRWLKTGKGVEAYPSNPLAKA